MTQIWPHRLRFLVGWLAVLLPVVPFYVLLFRESQNFPQADDYGAVLHYLNGFVTTQGAQARLVYFFSAQHFQYKVLFEQALFLADLKLTGQVDFALLQRCGDLFVLLTAIVLWLLFRPTRTTLPSRLLLFAPVVFLVFAPGYEETLDWTMGALQNLPVIFFSLLCLYLLRFERRWAFVVACLSLVCAIASSGNGFFLAIVAFAYLLQQKRPARAAWWTVVTISMGFVYAYHYIWYPIAAHPPGHHPLLVFTLFPFAFLGAAAVQLAPSLILGFLLLALTAALSSGQWRRTDPGTFYAAAFLIVTALGVTLTRHNLGIHAALPSRYAIYSQLLLALLYMAALHLGLDRLLKPARRRIALAAFAALAVIYCGANDVVRAQALHQRMQFIRLHYAGWKRAPSEGPLLPNEAPGLKTTAFSEFTAGATLIFKQSIELGIYKPPAVDSLSLPADTSHASQPKR